MTLVIGASSCKLCNFCKLDRLRPITKQSFILKNQLIQNYKKFSHDIISELFLRMIMII